MKQHQVSVIVVNWNGKHHLEECLSSLSNQTFEQFESILVDNGSTDGSVEFVLKHFPEVRIIRLKENVGFCRGNNIGFQHSMGDFVALLNNDTRVDRRWLEELCNAMEQDPEIGMCASCIANYFCPDILDTAGDGYDICGVGFKIGNGLKVTERKRNEYVFGACAGAALYRRSMIDEIGFFDNDFFAVGEDIDLSFRANLRGYKCVYVPSAVVYHKIGQTVGSDSDFLLYHARRNVEYAYFKNMPWPLVFLTLPLHVIYNLLTFAQALGQGRWHVFLKAKRDFLINFAKICKKRKTIQLLRKISLTELLSSFSKDYLLRRCKLLLRRGYL
jgi:GT2 family glycosyltransferase